MLVKFAIDPQALLKESNPLPTDFESLVEQWENFGVLVNPYQVEDEIDSFEFNIKIQLEEIFKDDDPPRRYRFEDSTGQLDWESLLDDNGAGLKAWSPTLELAIIGELLTDEIGVGNNGAPLSDAARQATYGNVEPIGLAKSDRARAWRHAWNIARIDFNEGEEHETLWNERFSRLAEFSSQIVIIDRHALHGRQFSGFLKLLQLIDRDGQLCRVTLFSSPSEDNDEVVSRIREMLHEEIGTLSGGGVQQVTVRLLPLNAQEHDRRIRFDRSVYAPENSIALVFSGDEGSVPQSVGCQLRPSDEQYHPFEVMKQTENELIRKARNLKWLINEQDYMVLYPNLSAS